MVMENWFPSGFSFEEIRNAWETLLLAGFGCYKIEKTNSVAPKWISFTIPNFSYSITMNSFCINSLTFYFSKIHTSEVEVLSFSFENKTTDVGEVFFYKQYYCKYFVDKREVNK